MSQAKIASVENRLEDLERRWKQKMKARIPLQYGTVKVDEKGSQTVTFSTRFEDKPQVFLSAMKQERWYSPTTFPSVKVDIPRIGLKQISIAPPEPISIQSVNLRNVEVPKVPSVSLPSIDILQGKKPSPPSIDFPSLGLKGIDLAEFNIETLEKIFKTLNVPIPSAPNFRDRFSLDPSKWNWKPSNRRGQFRDAMKDAVSEQIDEYVPDLPTLRIPKPWTLYANLDIDFWDNNYDIDVGFNKHWNIDLNKDVIQPIVDMLLWLVGKVAEVIAWILNIFKNAVIDPMVEEFKNEIKSRVQEAFNNFRGEIRDRMSEFRDNITSFVEDSVGENLNKLRNRLNDKISDGFDRITENAQSTINEDLIGTPDNPADGSINKVFDNLSAKLESKFDELGGKMTDTINSQIGSIIGDAKNPSEGTINYAVDKIKNSTESAFDEHGKNIRNKVQTTLNQFIGNPDNPQENSVNAAVDDVENTISKSVNTSASGTVDAVQAAVNDVIGDPNNPAEGTINYMVNKSNRAVEDNVNKAISRAQQGLNKSIDKIWSLIGLEEGVMLVPTPIEGISKRDFTFTAPAPGVYFFVATGKKIT